jgi:putative ABC transport system substrate-binding protein
MLVPAERRLYESRLDAFRGALRALGYVEGITVAYEYRTSEGRYERLPALAVELVKVPVDLILTAGTPAVQAAVRATTTIPVVAASIADPVATGIVPSLAKPGGNVTGLMFLVAELNAKRLEILKQTMPRLKKAALLMNAGNDAMAPVQQQVGRAAGHLGVEVMRVDVRGPEDFEGAFDAMAKGRAEAVVVVEDSMLNANAARLGALATARRLLSIGLDDIAIGGGLLAYGVDQVDMYRRAAGFVDRIFKGAKPGEMPIERSSTFEMVLNLKTAKHLGVHIAPNLRLRAERVIE